MEVNNSEKIKMTRFIVRRKELLYQRQIVNKELNHIEYILREFWGKDKYNELLKTERMKNLKQFKK